MPCQSLLSSHLVNPAVPYEYSLEMRLLQEQTYYLDVGIYSPI